MSLEEEAPARVSLSTEPPSPMPLSAASARVQRVFGEKPYQPAVRF